MKKNNNYILVKNFNISTKKSCVEDVHTTPANTAFFLVSVWERPIDLIIFPLDAGQTAGSAVEAGGTPCEMCFTEYQRNKLKQPGTSSIFSMPSRTQPKDVIKKVESKKEQQYQTRKSKHYTGDVFCIKDSRVFHCPDCPEISGVDKKDLISFSSTKEALEASGIPCNTCKPESEDTKRKTKKEPSTEPFDELIEGLKGIFGGKRK